ncbi:G-type lectin S-receptor-like serine/threonine-protein kinase SD3-1 [Tripterygium wilfordii]|uniref:Receptor-like serine/threonine-protein kinase n=1 Tax=Tripterygium wilfordii TaxID=458696 RepID=A0A7J7CUE9_TRIWF|nr:G-type lectin S-receptor-like serine/threonine-protein kinase SD3-1 [Tripterygium wilfordii]KAF5737701.1 G-type lectin S-receptor-like serine/threonine-protein kinase SD3-1 [Tripterygium wilfordii]
MLEQEIHFFTSTILLSVCTGFLLIPVVSSQIPLGSKLSIAENNSWISPNGDFAIGFFSHSDQPNQFSVGIHFNSKSIPLGKQIVVWVAGADVTVGNKSYFELSHKGEFVLFDSSTGVSAWTSKTSKLSVASALLHDDGNLILLNNEGFIVWQSFDTPSDTLLPGQNFSVYKMLRAASKNSVSSYYSLYMNASGQLQLKWESSVIYWTSHSHAHTNLTAVFTSAGALQILNQKLNIVWSAFGEDHNDSVSFRFLKLDVDGNLRLYSWIEASQSWRPVWQAIENQCGVFATCGERGICSFNSSGSQICECPFEFASEHVQRCLTPYQQSCRSGTSMLTYEHSYLYGIYPPNDLVILSSLQQCKNLCLKDPTCTAVTFMNDGTAQCRVKTTQYVSGYSHPSLGSVSFVKKCLDPFAADPNFIKPSQAQSYRPGWHEICIPCLVGASAATFVVFVAIQFAIGWFLYQRRTLIKKKATLAYTSENSKGLITFSFTEIKDLTGNFKHQIGPRMYRGVLPNHQPIAVKDLEGAIEERKFRSTVSKIGSIHHKNLVKLEGFCCESGNRFLVYEYAKNGSMEKCIEDAELGSRLTWERRLDICLSVARAIFYLHTGCREFISHENLKWGNVVLDKNFEAKVTEYGLGILREAASYAGGSAEKDIEDFGKMVLILLSGCQGGEDICKWAYKEWMEGHPERVVDKRIINSKIDLEELERALRIAFWCVQADERMRPSMGEVVKVLEGTVTVDPPPPPFAKQSLTDEEESSESGSGAKSPAKI